MIIAMIIIIIRLINVMISFLESNSLKIMDQIPQTIMAPWIKGNPNDIPKNVIA